jgi:hypothetical protein
MLILLLLIEWYVIPSFLSFMFTPFLGNISKQEDNEYKDFF